MLGIIKTLLGLAIGIGLPWWLGNNHAAIIWLLLPGLITVIFGPRAVLNYNLILTEARLGRPIRAVTYALILPAVMMAVFMLVPYFIGRWMSA